MKFLGSLKDDIMCLCSASKVIVHSIGCYFGKVFVGEFAVVDSD